MNLDYTGALNISFILFLISFVIFVLAILYKKNLFYIIASTTFIIGFIFNMLSFIFRWQASDHIPMSNTYETLVLFSMLIAIIYLYFWKTDKNKFIACGSSLLIVLIIGISALVDNVPRPLVPALQSNWLTIHVLFCFISYAAFAISFITAIASLLIKEPPPDLNQITRQNITLGYTFLVLGIITGSIWANRAWGTYWSWDPKETWSLITLLVYTLYLHSYNFERWAGKRSAMIAITGFIFIVFTYFGVNYLLSGLHSYS